MLIFSRHRSTLKNKTSVFDFLNKHLQTTCRDQNSPKLLCQVLESTKERLGRRLYSDVTRLNRFEAIFVVKSPSTSEFLHADERLFCSKWLQKSSYKRIFAKLLTSLMNGELDRHSGNSELPVQYFETATTPHLELECFRSFSYEKWLD